VRKRDIERSIENKLAAISQEDNFDVTDSFQCEFNDLTDALGLNDENSQKIRRKSDTSYWSGGFSSLEKKIGFLMFESISTRAQQARKKEKVHHAGMSKMRNALKKTLMIRDVNKTEIDRGIKRQLTVNPTKEMKEIKTPLKTPLGLNTQSYFTKRSSSKREEENNNTEGIMTIESMNGVESAKISKFAGQTFENKIYFNKRSLQKRPVLKTKGSLTKHQSISNDIKVIVIMNLFVIILYDRQLKSGL